MDAFVPQFNSLTIEQITEAFARQVVSNAKVNVSAVIRNNLPMWETKLFPVIGAYEISKYEVVADILIEAGCRSAVMSEAERTAFVGVVAKAVRRIRSENGELTATQKRAAARSSIPPELLRPGLVNRSKGDVVPPVVSVPGATPINGATAAVVSPKPMAVSATQSLPVEPSFSFRAAATRLKTEPRGTPWNELDDELHQAFLDLCKERGAISIKELRHYLKDNEQSKKDCLFQYMAKIDITKKVFN
jgi:hypothetical protein